jgi:hypothetical protein
LPAAVPLIVTVAVTWFAVATCEVLNVPLVAVQATLDASPANTPVNEQPMLPFGSVFVPSYVLFAAVSDAVIAAV